MPRDAPAVPAPQGGALLIAVLGAVAVVVAAIVIFIVADSDTVRAVALILEAVLTVGLIVYLYRMLTDTRGAAALPRASEEPALPLGTDISTSRLASAVATALRDAHALQRGTVRFAEAAAARAADADGAAGQQVGDLFGRQRTLAAEDARRLEDRLEELGGHAGGASDREVLLGEWLYERLLAHSTVTNARHGFGLAHLAAGTYEMLERLAVAANDQKTERLAADARSASVALASAWADAWDAVLDTTASEPQGDGGAATELLLSEAEGMEHMRARLLTVAAAQSQQAGIASGAEDAGLASLLDAIEQERCMVDDHLRRVRGRMSELGHHTPRLHGWESFGAARATALAEHVRGYRLARDVRDILASDHLEVATYELLERAALRAGDTETAEMAATLRDQASDGISRETAGIDAALQVTLLAE